MELGVTKKLEKCEKKNDNCIIMNDDAPLAYIHLFSNKQMCFILLLASL